MFYRLRALMALSVETILKTLNLAKEFLDLYLTAIAQPVHRMPMALALIPVEADQRQHASRAFVRRADRY